MKTTCFPCSRSSDPVLSICISVLCLINLVVLALHYYKLDQIPYGFHVDEMSSSVDIGCMATEGVDAHNVRHPLFSNVNYGTPKPPTWIYPGVLWSRIFGYSAPSLRALTVTMHLAGLAGLFFLGRLWLGRRYGLLVMTLGNLSPWAFPLSRVAFESLFSSTFIIWGMYFFFKPYGWKNALVAGLLFTAAAYTYPPFRLQTPLMLITLAFYAGRKVHWPKAGWAVFAVVSGLLNVPLVQKTMSGELQQRFNAISIFAHNTGWGAVESFFHNYFLHFSWDFLVLTGDPSYVHSTRHFGILSWLDMAGLGLGLFWLLMLLNGKTRKSNPWIQHRARLVFLMANILIGIIPAALTNSELPNSLRITGSWPFLCLLSGFMIWQAVERWPLTWMVVCLLSVVFAASFLDIYFNVYPQEAKGMFSYWTLDEARQLHTDRDWLKFIAMYGHQDYNARYFLMQYHGIGCTQSRLMWDNMNHYLVSRGL